MHGVACVHGVGLGAECHRQRHGNRSQRRTRHRGQCRRGGYYAGHQHGRHGTLHAFQRPVRRHAPDLLHRLQTGQGTGRGPHPGRHRNAGRRRPDRRRHGRSLRHGQEGVVHRLGGRSQGRRVAEARGGQHQQIVRRYRCRRPGGLGRRPAGRRRLGHRTRHRVDQCRIHAALRRGRRALRRLAELAQPERHRVDDRPQGRLGRCALRIARCQRRDRHHDQEGQKRPGTHIVQG